MMQRKRGVIPPGSDCAAQWGYSAAVDDLCKMRPEGDAYVTAASTNTKRKQ